MRQSYTEARKRGRERGALLRATRSRDILSVALKIPMRLQLALTHPVDALYSQHDAFQSYHDYVHDPAHALRALAFSGFEAKTQLSGLALINFGIRFQPRTGSKSLFFAAPHHTTLCISSFCSVILPFAFSSRYSRESEMSNPYKAPSLHSVNLREPPLTPKIKVSVTSEEMISQASTISSHVSADTNSSAPLTRRKPSFFKRIFCCAAPEPVYAPHQPEMVQRNTNKQVTNKKSQNRIKKWIYDASTPAEQIPFKTWAEWQ